jgi:SNF2 family DNA or RNA helicase
MPKLIRPKGIHYHPHQKSAIRWMAEREAEGVLYTRGGILADEMGLGKTLTTVGLLLNAPVPETLLLVPPMLQPQWCEVLASAGIPHRILGPPKSGPWREVGGKRSDIRVTVSTYDRATNQIELVLLDSYDRVVCDEGHVFRNGPKSRRFARLSLIAAERRWILTGTPVQNRVCDFRNLLRFIGVEKDDLTRKTLPTLAEELILRRTVEEVRDVVAAMPALRPTHTIHPVRMPDGSEEERVFAALVGRFEYAVEINAKGTIILELYLRIRQFLAHPAIYVAAIKKKYGASYKRESWTGTASKVAAFADFLASTPAEPTIVFGNFTDELDHASATLRSAGYSVWRIGGGMSDAARAAVTADSRAAAEAGTPVAIVIQIVAGSAGLNLQHCARVVFLSSHWNPTVVDQAIARAYRMGQTKHVRVHHLLLADDVEKNLDRYMARLHGAKRDAALTIHPKLFCDSAVEVETVLEALDAAGSAKTYSRADADDDHSVVEDPGALAGDD